MGSLGVLKKRKPLHPTGTRSPNRPAGNLVTIPATLLRFLFISHSKFKPNTSRDKKKQGTEKFRNSQKDVPMQANE
jgi:hypothetical protein